MRAAPRSLPARAALVAGAALAGPLLLTAPAWADTTGSTGSGSLTLLQGLGLFAGIPLLVVAVVYGLVYGLTGRRSRSRTAAALAASPVWFNGPESGAGPAALPAGDAAGNGGASARW